MDPDTNVTTARVLLAKKFTVIKESMFKKTKPVNHSLADEFLNGCVYVQTSLDLESCRIELKKLETDLGRERDVSNYSLHPIDLDIVVWNDHIIDRYFHDQPFLKEMVLEVLPGLKI